MNEMQPATIRANAGVIKALRDGLGVEDIAARKIASADHARAVVAKLRRDGLLRNVLRGE